MKDKDQEVFEWPINLKKYYVGHPYHSGAEIAGALIYKGFKIAEWERDLLTRQLSVVSRARQLTLLSTSARRLGFKRMPNDVEKIYERAYQNNFALCPPELGPLLMLSYDDLPPKPSYFLLGMNPIIDHNGRHLIFVAHRADGGLWTRVVKGPGAEMPSLDDVWLFAQYK